MKLQQLRYVVEIVRHGNHLSAAAETLNTSQPGVSRQIQLLELELGFEIFVRTRNRIIGLTEPGEHVVAIGQRVINDIAALRSLKEDISMSSKGSLTVGTTHTQARYVLPNVVAEFVKSYPDVRLIMKQGDPEEICALVDTGDADLAIGTETIRRFPNLVKLPCFDLGRSVIAQEGHPILDVPKLTLAEIAKYPIIMYDQRYSGRWKVMEAFQSENIEPKIILSSIDADVSKTYVSMGLGIAILTTVTYDEKQDVGLVARDASDLFAASTVSISLRTNTYLRPYMLEFIRLAAPHLTANVVRDALSVQGGGGRNAARS